MNKTGYRVNCLSVVNQVVQVMHAYMLSNKLA